MYSVTTDAAFVFILFKKSNSLPLDLMSGCSSYSIFEWHSASSTNVLVSESSFSAAERLYFVVDLGLIVSGTPQLHGRLNKIFWCRQYTTRNLLPPPPPAHRCVKEEWGKHPSNQCSLPTIWNFVVIYYIPWYIMMVESD